MSARTVWVTHQAIFAAMALLTFVTGLVATILQSERIGGVAGVFGCTALVLVAAEVAWIESVPRASHLSRSDRRRLRDEQSRIRIEAEIKRMEREAGL